jgi:DUF971 family protein
MTNADIWPTEIRLSKDRKTVTVGFEDGSSFDLPAEYLRVMSPSAEVQGHSAADKKTVPGKRDVEIMQIEPVGHYAVRLVFDDMHQTGLFTWVYLHELGQKYDEKWQVYLDELASRGMSRDPAVKRRP